MKRIVFVPLLVISLSSGLVAQETLPAGTAVPVTLTSSLAAGSRPGQQITAKIMQRIPAEPGLTIPAGAKVIGRVIETKRDGEGGTGSTVSFQFDRIVTKAGEIPVRTSLRAIASPTEVWDAQTPKTGPDEGTSQQSWTTVRVGDDVVYRGGGAVMAGSTVVGKPTDDGVLVRLTAPPGSGCGEASGNGNQLQALWVFSSAACGVYGFSDLTIQQAGKMPPLGVIVLSSLKKDWKLRGGTGLLLQIVGGSR